MPGELGPELTNALAAARSRVHWLRRVRLCAHALFVVAILLAGLQWAQEIQPLPGIMWIRCSLMLGAFLTAYRVFSERNPVPTDVEMAQAIERRFPELQQSLLTAVTMSPAQAREDQLLRQLLLVRLEAHAQEHRWSDILSGRDFLRPIALGSVATLACGFAVLAGQWRGSASPPVPAVPGRTAVVQSLLPIVEPGDVWVERGQDLVVTAEYADEVPALVELVVHNEAGQTIHPMPQALDDPLFAATLDDVSGDAEYVVRSSRGTSRRFRIQVYDLPQLLAVDATLHFPDYTTLESPQTINDTRDLAIPEGTAVTLVCRVSGPVQSVELREPQGQVRAFESQNASGECWRLDLKPTQTATCEIMLTDEQGRHGRRPAHVTIQVLPNRRPELKITFPQRDLQVTPVEELALEAEVTDDFGLVDAGLVYTVVGREPVTVTLPAGTDASRFRHLACRLALEALDVVPNQLVSYHFFAEDRDCDGSIRHTCSDIFFAEVRPFEEEFRQAQSAAAGAAQLAGSGKKDQKLEAVITQQREVLVATWNVTRNGPVSGDDLLVLKHAQHDVRTAAEGLRPNLKSLESVASLERALQAMQWAGGVLEHAGEMPTNERIAQVRGYAQSAYQELLKLRTHEHRVMQSQGGGGGGGGGSRSQEQLQQLELTTNAQRYESQDAARQTRSSRNGPSLERLRILNRLQELKRRQQGLNDAMQQWQHDQRLTESTKPPAEAERMLKRLRDQQRELLRELDQLQQQMDATSLQEKLGDARSDLKTSRKRVHEASEALRNGQVARALAAGQRAERQLDQLRDEVRRRTAHQFEDALRRLCRNTRQLVDTETTIQQRLHQLTETQPRRLQLGPAGQALQESLAQQQLQLESVVRDLQSLMEDAETAEPLLARRLNGTARDALRLAPATHLSAAADALRANDLQPAIDHEDRAAEGLRVLHDGVERAAEAILGSQLESLKLARSQVRDLTSRLEEQLAQSAARGSSADSRAGGDSAARDSSASGGAPADSASASDSSGGSGAPGASSTAANASGSGGSPGKRTGSSRANSGGSSGGPGGGPGGAFSGGALGNLVEGASARELEDRLRDVQDLLEDDALRQRVAAVRDSARSLRAEFRRHARAPNWDALRDELLEPLVELQQELSAEVSRRESPEALVPLDREPVPRQYDRLVRRYYEGIGSRP